MLRQMRLLIILACLPVLAMAKDASSDSQEPIQLELWPELKNSFKVSPAGFEFQEQAKVTPPPGMDQASVNELKRHAIVISSDAPKLKFAIPESPLQNVIAQGHTYQVGGDIDSSSFTDYMGMSDQYKHSFHINRSIYLTQAARLLTTAFITNTLGTGSVIANQTSWAWNTLKHYSNYAAATPSNFQTPGDLAMAFDQVRARDNSYGEAPARDRSTFAQRRTAMVQHLLNGIDRQFWSNPYLTANSNEFAAYISVGPTLFAGYERKEKTEDGVKRPGKKWGMGGSMDLGIMLGWNKSSSTAVIQVFTLTEKFKGTMTGFTANAAVVVKGGITLASLEKGQEMKPETGKVSYPPMPPPISAYYLKSPKRFAVGANPPFGLVPWPFDAILIYDMDYLLRPLLRINLRFEVFRDFLSFDTGPKGDAKNYVKSSVLRKAAQVRSIISGRKMCVSAHSG